MPDGKFWNQLDVWDAVGQAAAKLLQMGHGRDDFRAALGAFRAALDACAAHSSTTQIEILKEDLQAIPPGSEPDAYRDFAEVAKSVANFPRNSRKVGLTDGPDGEDLPEVRQRRVHV